jgi:dipeptidase
MGGGQREVFQLWFGNDDANMIPLVPVYPGSMKTVPECFHQNAGNAFTFSFRSAYWLQNWVSNMVYYRYCQLFPELCRQRDRMERDWLSLQADVEREALAAGEDGSKVLNDYSHRACGQMMDEWMSLAQRLITRYNDMSVKAMDEEGRYIKTSGGQPRSVERPGYPESYRRRIAAGEGGRYRLPKQ